MSEVVPEDVWPEQSVRYELYTTALTECTSYKEYLERVYELAGEITSAKYAKIIMDQAMFNNIHTAFDEHGTLGQILDWSIDDIEDNRKIAFGSILAVLEEHLQDRDPTKVAEKMEKYRRRHFITTFLRSAVQNSPTLQHLSWDECRTVASHRAFLGRKPVEEIENYALVVEMSNLLFTCAKQLMLQEGYSYEEIAM